MTSIVLLLILTIIIIISYNNNKLFIYFQQYQSSENKYVLQTENFLHVVFVLTVHQFRGSEVGGK